MGVVGQKKVPRLAVRVHLEATASTKWHLFWDVRVKGVIDIYRHIAQTAYGKDVEMEVNPCDLFNVKDIWL